MGRQEDDSDPERLNFEKLSCPEGSFPLIKEYTLDDTKKSSVISSIFHN